MALDKQAAVAGQKAPSINTAFSATLARIHKKLKPWHVYTVLAAGLLAIILAVVLTYVRDQQRKTVSVQVQTPSNQSTARVNLEYAQYQGTVLTNGIAQYLGLRYAKSPIGELRWRAPVEPDQVEGDQAANTLGKMCLATSTALPSSDEDEDCLFANVWTPANATSDSKLPVWVFIQGGGYVTNVNTNWNGSAVVEASGRNIVFVNFHYRVGLYGFLASERVRDDGDLNVGLLDQRRLMQWIQQYITEFGGDPDHVVIDGASAGAGSVAHHLTAYGGKDEGLFHGVIVTSVFFPTQPSVSELEWQFDLVLNQAGCSSAADPMSCLRGKDLATLQATNVPSPLPGTVGTSLPLFYWGPCTDGDLIRNYLYVMFENGDFIDVPVISGTNNDEGSIFGVNAASSDQVAAFFESNYPHLDNATTEIIATYPLEPSLPLHAAWFPSAERAYGEATFICPNIHILNSIEAKLNSSAAPVWAYRYDVLSAENVNAGLGVPHGWETWAVFGPDSILGTGNGPSSYYGANAPIVPVIMHYWISFVRMLDPNVLRYTDAPEWTTWSQGFGNQQLRFETGNVSMETAATDLLGRCEFWKGLSGIMEQ